MQKLGNTRLSSTWPNPAGKAVVMFSEVLRYEEICGWRATPRILNLGIKTEVTILIIATFFCRQKSCGLL